MVYLVALHVFVSYILRFNGANKLLYNICIVVPFFVHLEHYVEGTTYNSKLIYYEVFFVFVLY